MSSKVVAKPATPSTKAAGCLHQTAAGNVDQVKSPQHEFKLQHKFLAPPA